MKKSARKTTATTQKFIEILDIADDIVFLSGSNACLVIEVQATNFSLLSKEEQDAKILSYSSLLNSLSFPIQIFIRSKKIDITSYLKLLEEEIKKNQSEVLRNQIALYKNFVQELVKVNTVLDKKFYVVIPYSGLERGMGRKDNFFMSAKSKLISKAESLHEQLRRVNLPSRTLRSEDLVRLFHEIYNGDIEGINEIMQGNKFPIVKKPIRDIRLSSVEAQTQGKQDT